MYGHVLRFWFKDIEPKTWWAAAPSFDERVRERFLPMLDQAAKGELYGRRISPRGGLAEIVVLDQFSRNVYRNTPRAFVQDPMALVLSQEVVALGVPE